jgi:hypothetical protein
VDPEPRPTTADDWLDARRTIDAKPFDFDPEDPHAGADRDSWLKENVPPHHEWTEPGER